MTVAVPRVAETLTAVTPGTRRRARVTRFSQESHVIPVMGTVTALAVSMPALVLTVVLPVPVWLQVQARSSHRRIGRGAGWERPHTPWGCPNRFQRRATA